MHTHGLVLAKVAILSLMPHVIVASYDDYHINVKHCVVVDHSLVHRLIQRTWVEDI